MKVTKQMSIGEVLRLDPGTTSIFMEFGMHCLTCPCATAEAIEEACLVHGTDPDELVERLNAYLGAE